MNSQPIAPAPPLAKGHELSKILTKLGDEIRALPGDVTPEQVRDAVMEKMESAFGPAPTTMPIVAYVVTAKKTPPKKGLFARMLGN